MNAPCLSLWESQDIVSGSFIFINEVTIMADLWYRKDAPKIAMIYGSNPRWDSSEAELLLAAKYDLIITSRAYARLGDVTAQKQEKLNDNLKRLHDMNPRLKVLFYFTGGAEYRRGTRYFSDDCFLKTTEGDIINSWPGSCLLNYANPKTVQCFNDMVDDLWPVGAAVDGIYFDTMFGWFDQWAVELESKKKVKVDANEDGLEDDISELEPIWIEAKRQILAHVREAYGDKPYLMVNAGHYSAYARPYADGNILEDYIDQLLIPEAYSGKTFDQLMDYYQFWSQSPEGRTNCTYINATPGFDIDYAYDRINSNAGCNRILQRGYESLQRMRFGLAFALLGNSHYTFQLSGRSLGQHWWYPEYDIPIGKPLGEYYRHEDGTYRRDYENAIVVLNNSYHDIQPHFEQTMRDGTTSWVGRDFNLPSKDGRIYVRVGL